MTVTEGKYRLRKEGNVQTRSKIWQTMRRIRKKSRTRPGKHQKKHKAKKRKTRAR